MGEGPAVLWRPPPEAADTTNLGRLLHWLAAERGRQFDGYDDLWRWSPTASSSCSSPPRPAITWTTTSATLGSMLAQQARVALLDEPSSGIAQKEAEALGPLLRRIRDVTGTALVIVEHDVPLLRATCDRLVAMEFGAVIAVGPPEEVVRDPRWSSRTSALTRRPSSAPARRRGCQNRR